MAAAIAGVADGDRQIVGRLPLQVEGEVDRVGQDVVLVIGAEVQRCRAIGVTFLVVDAAAVRFP